MQAMRHCGYALLGAAVGATVALLYAPASGEQTRRRLSRGIEDQREALAKRSQAIRDSVRDSRRRLERGIEDQREALARKGRAIQDRVRDGRRQLAAIVTG